MKGSAWRGSPFEGPLMLKLPLSGPCAIDEIHRFSNHCQRDRAPSSLPRSGMDSLIEIDAGHWNYSRFSRQMSFDLLGLASIA